MRRKYYGLYVRPFEWRKIRFLPASGIIYYINISPLGNSRPINAMSFRFGFAKYGS